MLGAEMAEATTGGTSRLPWRTQVLAREGLRMGGRDPTQFMVAKAVQTLGIVSGFDVDTSSVYFGVR